MPALRCDHCDALLQAPCVESYRNRFCCVDCKIALARGDLKAISPHDHTADLGAQLPSRAGDRQPVSVPSYGADGLGGQLWSAGR